jgi:CPA2 family monovalent cation:H+ antiporter-2
MGHDTAIIGTIGTGLGLAFVLGFLARRLRIPPLVGYLAAGIVAGPFTPLLAPGLSANGAIAAQLAEIGVILLMFGVGIHFSFAQLMAVRATAIPGALGRIGIVTGIGVLLARAWGWPVMAGVVFGLTLAVASTVVLLRTLEEEGSLDSVEGRVAVGWLIVEDIAMVLVLVMLPAIASPLGGADAPIGVSLLDGSVWAALLLTLGKVGAFLVLMLVVGRRFVPWLLERVAREGSRELFTLAVLSLALGIAVGAAAIFGVSFALGAFFAGVVISESDLSHQAASDALPLQDAFAVLFFFSIGMLFDPRILLEHPLQLLIVLLVIIPVRVIIVAALMLLARHPVHRALTVAGGLAQVGEFSFILAALGIALNILPVDGQNLMLAGALLSITLNPLVIRGLKQVERWITARPGLQDFLERIDEQDPLRTLEGGSNEFMRGHAVLIGHGRVGSMVGYALEQAGIPYIVIEQNRTLVTALRTLGVPAVFGDATRAFVREQAGVRHARLLIVTTPDPFQARTIVSVASRECPDLITVVRTHAEAESRYLRQLRVNRVVMGEKELAFGMAHFALMAMGRTDDDADRAMEELRAIE